MEWAMANFLKLALNSLYIYIYLRSSRAHLISEKFSAVTSVKDDVKPKENMINIRERILGEGFDCEQSRKEVMVNFNLNMPQKK